MLSASKQASPLNPNGFAPPSQSVKTILAVNKNRGSYNEMPREFKRELSKQLPNLKY
jgi:hypothetical protein